MTHHQDRVDNARKLEVGHVVVITGAYPYLNYAILKGAKVTNGHSKFNYLGFSMWRSGNTYSSTSWGGQAVNRIVHCHPESILDDEVRKAVYEHLKENHPEKYEYYRAGIQGPSESSK